MEYFLIGFSFRMLQLKKKVHLKMISDQSEATRTPANLTEEDNFQFACSKDDSCYIHEQNVIWDMCIWTDAKCAV